MTTYEEKISVSGKGKDVRSGFFVLEKRVRHKVTE